MRGAPSAKRKSFFRSACRQKEEIFSSARRRSRTALSALSDRSGRGAPARDRRRAAAAKIRTGRRERHTRRRPLQERPHPSAEPPKRWKTRAERRSMPQGPRFFVQRLFFCGGGALFLCAGGRRAVRGQRANHRSERAVQGGELFYIFSAVDAELRLGGDALFAVRAFRGTVQPSAAAHAVDGVFNIFRSAGRTVHS